MSAKISYELHLLPRVRRGQIVGDILSAGRVQSYRESPPVHQGGGLSG